LVRRSITHSHRIVTFSLFAVPLTMPLTIHREFKPFLRDGDSKCPW
jgi:hypothetical protein